MTTKPQIRIYNNDGTFIDRAMNDKEFTQYELDQQNVIKAEAELKAQSDNKAAVLKKLGLSEDEVAALLS